MIAAVVHPAPVETIESATISAIGFLNDLAPIFLVAFLVTLLVTPAVRRIAIVFDIIDHPDETRKAHSYPVAYLGGMAVFVGLISAIALSYAPGLALSLDYESVPIAIVIGMIAITFTGLADDVWGWDPRLKIAGQLVAAAALAIEEVGVNVATGALSTFFGGPDEVLFAVSSFEMLNGTMYYWVGTAIIAIFVLGACNASNFIDGLDGLLSGTVAIVCVGLLAISLLMVSSDDKALADARAMVADLGHHVTEYESTHGRPPDGPTFDDMVTTLLEVGAIETAPRIPKGWRVTYVSYSGEIALDGATLTGARVILCLAVLGAVLGFLPHNFNPASIFLGDCGSLMLGYMCAVIILMLGERGHTHLVAAGLIVFALPIIDTILAIIRRKLAGVPMSSPDAQHLHHQIKRATGSVKRAVFVLYGLSALFATAGVTLAMLVMHTELKVRAIYAIVIVLFGFVTVIAVKAARRQQIEQSIGNAASVRARNEKK